MNGILHVRIYLQAKAKYEKDQRRKELAKQRGEDTWMLDSINTRVDQEQRVRPLS